MTQHVIFIMRLVLVLDLISKVTTGVTYIGRNLALRTNTLLFRIEGFCNNYIAFSHSGFLSFNVLIEMKKVGKPLLRHFRNERAQFLRMCGMGTQVSK